MRIRSAVAVATATLLVFAGCAAPEEPEAAPETTALETPAPEPTPEPEVDEPGEDELPTSVPRDEANLTPVPDRDASAASAFEALAFMEALLPADIRPANEVLEPPQPYESLCFTPAYPGAMSVGWVTGVNDGFDVDGAILAAIEQAEAAGWVATFFQGQRGVLAAMVDNQETGQRVQINAGPSYPSVYMNAEGACFER